MIIPYINQSKSNPIYVCSKYTMETWYADKHSGRQNLSSWNTPILAVL